MKALQDRSAWHIRLPIGDDLPIRVARWFSASPSRTLWVSLAATAPVLLLAGLLAFKDAARHKPDGPKPRASERILPVANPAVARPAALGWLGSDAFGPQQRFLLPPEGILAADFFARQSTAKLDHRAPEMRFASVNDVLKISGPYTIIDSRTFAPPNMLIVLSGVEGPERDAVCLNGEGFPFACGLSARAALHNMIVRTDLSCRVTRQIDGDLIEADCQSASGNIGDALVKAGWLRPATTDQTPSVARLAAAESARSTGSGLWDGKWRFRQPPRE